jgi:hypothetical protein
MKSLNNDRFLNIIQPGAVGDGIGHCFPSSDDWIDVLEHIWSDLLFRSAIKPFIQKKASFIVPLM